MGGDGGAAGSGVSLGLSLHSAAHPLDPLTPTEIAVAIASVRAEGDTPEVSKRREADRIHPCTHQLLLQTHLTQGCAL